MLATVAHADPAAAERCCAIVAEAYLGEQPQRPADAERVLLAGRAHASGLGVQSGDFVRPPCAALAAVYGGVVRAFASASPPMPEAAERGLKNLLQAGGAPEARQTSLVSVPALKSVKL